MPLYTPQESFSFNRAYLWGMTLCQNFATLLSFIDDTLIWRYDNGAGYRSDVTITFYENMLPWSSNSYSLGYAIQSAFYQELQPPFGSGIWDWHIRYMPNFIPGQSHLVFHHVSGTTLAQQMTFELEHKPIGYWDVSSP